MKTRIGQDLLFESKLTSLELYTCPFNEELYTFYLDLGRHANKIKKGETYNTKLQIESRIPGAKLSANLSMKLINNPVHRNDTYLTNT